MKWDYEVIVSDDLPDAVILNKLGQIGYQLVCLNFNTHDRKWYSYLKRQDILYQLKQLDTIDTSISSFRGREFYDMDVGLNQYLLDPLTRKFAKNLLSEYSSNGNQEATEALILWKAGHVVKHYYPDQAVAFIETYPYDSFKCSLYADRDCVIIHWHNNKFKIDVKSLDVIILVLENSQVFKQINLSKDDEQITISNDSRAISLYNNLNEEEAIIIMEKDIETFINILNIGRIYSQNEYDSFLEESNDYGKEDYHNYNDWDDPDDVLYQRFREENGRYPEEGEY